MKMKKTLCWICNNACGRCSWSKDYKPVEGWKAKPTKIRFQDIEDDSFCVIECPEFELLESVKEGKIQRAKWLPIIPNHLKNTGGK